MAPLRLFIAANLSDDQRRKAAALVEDLRKGIQFTRSFPKWVQPEAMHLTLKFLGDVEENRVTEIGSAVGRGISGARAFEFSMRGLGVFPSERQPKVLWIGGRKGVNEMTSLAVRVDAACHRLGFERESRPFKPHLTLARIKALRGAQEFMDVVKSHGPKADLGAATVDHLTLYQSTLTPQGAIYKALKRWNLSPAAPPGPEGA